MYDWQSGELFLILHLGCKMVDVYQLTVFIVILVKCEKHAINYSHDVLSKLLFDPYILFLVSKSAW